MSTATKPKPPTIAQRATQAAEKAARYLEVENAKLLGAVLAEVASDELRYNRRLADRVRVAYEAAAPKPKRVTTRIVEPKARKRTVKLIPIKDVGLHQIDITGQVDPYYLYEVFGLEQLPLALGEFSREKLLEEAVPAVQKRHPGEQPKKSASKQTVISFIVQRVVNN